MPSSYLKFAEDFDGDGRRDIWSTPSDVFASIANYLQGHGWTADQTWGREVRLTPDAARRIARDVAPRDGTCRATRNMTVALPLERWQALGVRLAGGAALPKSDLQASLVSGSTRHFLVYPNYDALLDYNCAHSYAISVALLGDAIASKAPLGKTQDEEGRQARRPARAAPGPPLMSRRMNSCLQRMPWQVSTSMIAASWSVRRPAERRTVSRTRSSVTLSAAASASSR